MESCFKGDIVGPVQYNDRRPQGLSVAESVADVDTDVQ